MDEAKDREADGEHIILSHDHTRPYVRLPYPPCGFFSDEWEEMCIVAVEKTTAEALNMQDMHSLMLAIGLTPPSEQVASLASLLTPA